MALIYLREALMTGKRLPYDAEVEYLESTGTQWIDTGYNFSGPCSMYLSASFLPEANERDLFGAYAVGGNNMVCGCYARFIFGYNNPGVRIDSATFAASEADFDIEYSFLGSQGSGGSRNLVVNGTTYTGAGVYYNNLSVTLFRANPNYTSKFKCCAFKIRDAQGNLVRDFIPVRIGTVGYLYDRVSKRLFGNAGTGDFVLGPDVVPVEYLQSDGGQYIQTNFTPDDSYGFEVDCFTPVASSSYNSRAIGLQNGQVRWLYCTERRASSDSFFGWNEAILVGNQPDKRIVARCNWLNNRTISIGDTVYKSNLATLNSVGGLKAVLFGINNGGSVLTSQLFVGKMYSAKVSVGNAIGYNYAPVRVGTGTTWEGAMMDTLTRRIYRNAGTGAFGYGNDLKYPIPAE